MSALRTATLINNKYCLDAFQWARFSSKTGQECFFSTVEEAIAFNEAQGCTCIIQPPIAGWPMPGMTFVEVYKSGPESSWIEAYWTPGTCGLAA